MTPEEYANAIRELIEAATADRVAIYAIPDGDGGHRLFAGHFYNDADDEDILIADVGL